MHPWHSPMEFMDPFRPYLLCSKPVKPGQCITVSYYMATSEAKWNTLVDWFSVSEAKSFKKFSSQQYNYRKRNIVLHVKGYHSKFADRRRRLRTFTSGSVRSLKETMPCNLSYFSFTLPRKT